MILYNVQHTDIVNGRLKKEILESLVSNKIKRLIVRHNTLIKEIPKIASLEMLMCDYCPNIKVLPSLPNLTMLSCERTSIKELPKKISKLKFLSISGCRLLKSIPFHKNLEELYCSGTKLEEIYEYKHLKVLYCDLCNKLKKIPYLKNLEELSCNNCHVMNSNNIHNITSYNAWKKKVDTLVLLLKSYQKNKIPISNDLIRELTEKYL